MEAKDLRLNSLVNYTDDGDTLLHTILAITETEGILLECNGIFEHVEPELIEPIPLTEERIDKLGIEIKKEGDYLENEIVFNAKSGKYRYIIESYESNCGDWNYSYIEVEYVHKLQNVHYALTGEELKIK